MVKVRRGYKSKNVRVTGATGGRAGGGLRLPTSRGGKAGAGVGGMGILGVIVVVVLSLLGGGGGGGLGSLGLDGGALSGGGAGADDLPVIADSDLEEWSAVFDDIQNTWIDIFGSAGLDYRISTLTIFNGSTATGGCGNVPAQAGPFYCPADDGVYFDPAFFRELADQFGAPGDFAIAYVLAHEIGHHVQNLTGVSTQVREQQQNASQGERNALTIRLELQADCLAGVWAFEAAQRPRTLNGNDNLLYLEAGDIGEGMAAAAAVGDDNIQETVGQQINPHNWTHGSSEQRQAWLRLGLETGDPAACNDTFDSSVPATEIMPSR
jgi:predicted metalloprotease